MKLYPLYNNQVLLTSSSPTFAGLTIGAAGHVVLPLHNDATTPTLAFGDGNTGFYEDADNSITVSIAGTATYRFNSLYFAEINTGGASIRAAAPTANVPNIVPSLNDNDTGIGLFGADALSLIAGTVEGIRITEATTITVRLSDKVSVSNTAEGNVCSLNIQTAREVHTLTLGVSSVTTGLNIPTTALVLGAAFCVNTAVTDDAGNDTWSAAFSGGDASAIVAAVAPAQNTKAHSTVVPALTNAETEITFTPQGGSFGAGVIEVVAWYIDLTDLANV